MEEQMKQVKKQDINTFTKARELAESVSEFSDLLPEENLNDLKIRLKYTAESISPAIEEGFSQKRRIDRLRLWIKANTYLEEVRDYLNMVEVLRYAKTDELVSKIDEMADILKKNYSYFNKN